MTLPLQARPNPDLRRAATFREFKAAYRRAELLRLWRVIESSAWAQRQHPESLDALRTIIETEARR